MQHKQRKSLDKTVSVIFPNILSICQINLKVRLYALFIPTYYLIIYEEPFQSSEKKKKKKKKQAIGTGKAYRKGRFKTVGGVKSS